MSGYQYQPAYPAGKLPILVGILALLIGVVGLFFVVIALLLLLTGFGLLAFSGASAYGLVAGGALFAGAINLVFGAVLVAVARGLWDVEEWALWVTGITLAAIVAWFILTADFGWGLLIAVGLLIYLVAVRDHFY